MFRKILIANRGEVACRIIRSCRELGIKSVAVYSSADKDSPHVLEADESVCIGRAQSNQSYLQMETILQAAIQMECQAIHPGYGFLSENSIFAELCRQYNINFIGPLAGTINKMGDKNAARTTMSSMKIDVIPGSQSVVRFPEKEAQKIGFPLLLKAVAGGGGKGMRICRTPEDLLVQYKEASLEAEKAFANPNIYFEKYIKGGKHIEFQVLADHYGNVVHLGERECSVQRNHQKLIEESPSPVISEQQRKELGNKLTSALQKIGYRNAGTIELLMDGENLYFMEMNTRLQVEHPVTEMVTGIDIVKQQLKIAANHELQLEQSDIKLTGHAIECRINAENPDENFKPCPGKITKFIPPKLSEKVRLDTHVKEGYEVPVFYDSMIAKLIVHGKDREDAIATMKQALQSFVIEGVKTTIPLLLTVIENEEFISGNYTTQFLENLLG
ncbi:acetyl-CoA carboxylase biotin carboxylase subunit [Candidatus Uabimicrobium sp. HlEnr_7]|uniref:acetyl-CoA carboxylase biotin carboxylase subunit n=1 Tax=Candidatus Uabimicrobium helgolandensis TaxID=3095367 RepID=UPI003555DCD5